MLRGLRFFYRFCWKTRKSYILLNILNQLLLGLLPLVILSVPKFLLDELLGRQRPWYLVGCCGIVLTAIF